MSGMVPAANMPDMTQVGGELDVRTILTVEGGGNGPEMALPTSLPAFNPPMPPITRKLNSQFTVQRDPSGEFISFGVDGIPLTPTGRRTPCPWARLRNGRWSMPTTQN